MINDVSDLNITPVETIKKFDYSGTELEFPHYKQHNFNFGSDVPVQTAFAYHIANQKGAKYYVELGAGHYESGNNTYILEKFFNWTGVAIDIQKNWSEIYNEKRSNFCINGDALSFNWDKYFEENNFPKQIDYLQIDVDGQDPNNNLIALFNLPLSRYRFTGITIEHDSGRDFKLKRVRDIQREILSSMGYDLVVDGRFEDFWVDKEMFESSEEYSSMSEIRRVLA
jgi:hypothetical protein